MKTATLFAPLLLCLSLSGFSYAADLPAAVPAAALPSPAR